MFELASRIQNANLTRAEAGAALRVIDCLIFLWKHRLDAVSLKNFSPLQEENVASLGRDPSLERQAVFIGDSAKIRAVQVTESHGKKFVCAATIMTHPL